jgi:hypothetical protein
MRHALASGLLFLSLAWAWTVGCPYAVPAIEAEPSQAQIAEALEQGKAAAAKRIPPDRLYAWFGSTSELEPKGFLMTKMAGLIVMSAHFALRGQTPTEQDIHQILDDRSLLVSVIIFGDRPNFAVDSYMLLFQSEKVIKPVKVRFDGSATRTSVWPQHPAYQAKVVASFLYAELVPQAQTRISVFPADSGEVTFDVDFSTID